MKFQQIKIGQVFEYQGNVYIKHSPLIAVHRETGKQKLIPRYAAIVATDSSVAATGKKPALTLKPDQVQIAFDTFYNSVVDSLQRIKPKLESQAAKSLQNNLENARQQFLNDLGLPHQTSKTT